VGVYVTYASKAACTTSAATNATRSRRRSRRPIRIAVIVTREIDDYFTLLRGVEHFDLHARLQQARRRHRQRQMLVRRRRSLGEFQAFRPRRKLSERRIRGDEALAVDVNLDPLVIAGVRPVDDHAIGQPGRETTCTKERAQEHTVLRAIPRLRL